MGGGAANGRKRNKKGGRHFPVYNFQFMLQLRFHVKVAMHVMLDYQNFIICHVVQEKKPGVNEHQLLIKETLDILTIIFCLLFFRHQKIIETLGTPSFIHVIIKL